MIGSRRTIDDDDIEQPPQPPKLERRLDPPLPQLLMVLFLGSIVLAAALGAFGESRGTADAHGPSLGLAVDYPTRARYSELQSIVVHVGNNSRRRLDVLTVSFDSAYVARFSEVQIIPSATRPWEVHIRNVEPGGSRRVLMEMRSDSYGRISGNVSAVSDGDTVSADFRTLIFP